MNANYRVVWSAVRKALMVVNELSSTGHAGSVAAAASVAVMLGAAALPAQAAVDLNKVCQDGKCVLENITENGSSSLILQGPNTAMPCNFPDPRQLQSPIRSLKKILEPFGSGDTTKLSKATLTLMQQPFRHPTSQ